MSDTADSNNVAVILVPHAGGDGLSYAGIVRRLSAGGDVYFFEMAGHGKRAAEAFYSSYEEILDELVIFIKDIAAEHEKYILCGDSLGAYLCDNAYERLEAEGARLPSHVVYAAVDPGRRSLEFSIAGIMEKSTNMEILNADNHYCRYLKRILEKDLELLTGEEIYFKARLKCPMSFFMGKDDRLLGKVVFDWSELAPLGYREYLFEGEHLFMTSNKNVVEQLKKIRERLQG